MSVVELRIGQVVAWPGADCGLAQIAGFRVKRISLFFMRGGRLRKGSVDAGRVARKQLLSPWLPGFEPPPDYSICPPDPVAKSATRLVDAEAGLLPPNAGRGRKENP